MVTDSQTNFLYLADTLPIAYPAFFKNFEQALIESEIQFELLPQTKDVWAVDYMPIQIQVNQFVSFVYRPDYLIKYKKYQKTISDVDKICNELGIEKTNSNIVLDGGNIVRTKNKVIMTTRVFKENPFYEQKKLIKELYELLQVDNLYIIPEQPQDFTGHADGMVRFLDEYTLIINDFKKEKQEFYYAFQAAIHNIGLDYVIVPYNVYDNQNAKQANVNYINYLQMEKDVVVPIFGIDEDDSAVRRFEKLFDRHKVSTINSNEIAKEGGILNCITWNIKK